MKVAVIQHLDRQKIYVFDSEEEAKQNFKDDYHYLDFIREDDYRFKEYEKRDGMTFNEEA